MGKYRFSIWRLSLVWVCLLLPPGFAVGQTHQKPLKDDDVIAMVKGGLAESTIISAIKAQETSFDVSAAALIRLQQQGVSPNVMRAMLNAAKKEAAPSPAASEGGPANAGPTNLGRSEVPFPKSVPLTSYAMDLLAIRDNPQLIDDIALKLTEAQIQVEQSVWQQIHGREHPMNHDRRVSSGPPFPGLNPKRPTFIFEWQKLITERPELARGPLLHVFLSPDADWSFVKREPGWDDRFNAIVEPFIFSQKAIEGRNPEFAAHELVPVMKQFLKLAAAKAPTDFWLTVNLPYWQYDFDTKAIRFDKPGTNTFIPTVNLLRPITDAIFTVPPKGSQADGMLLPADARSHLNYGFFTDDDRTITPTLPSETQPGVEMQSPAQGWRDALPMLGRSILSFQALALDRKLAISGIPMDSKSAERLMNGQSLHGPHSTKTGPPVAFTARVYIHADHIEIDTMPGGQRRSDAFMFASVQKVEILGLHDQVVATLGPESFRAAKEVLAAAAVAEAKAKEEAKEKRAQEAAHRLQVQKAFEEQMNRNKEIVRRESEAGSRELQAEAAKQQQIILANEKKQLDCSARAFKAAKPVYQAHRDSKEYSKVYNDTYNACMKEK